MECIICRELLLDQSFIKIFKYAKNGQEYRLYYCPKCDLQFWWPLRFYARFYEAELPEHELLTLGIRPLPFYAVDFFNSFQDKRGRLLDVGCGDGAFVEEAQKSGFNAEGIDLNDKAITAARKLRQLKNIKKEYLASFSQRARSAGEQYDIVTFFEVLEHQDDPKKFIFEIKSCLRKEGRIAGSVPNRERYFPDLHKSSELGDFPPAHFTRWSKRSLEWFLADAGFINIRVLPIGYARLWDVVNHLNFNLWDRIAYKIKLAVLRDRKKASLDFSGLERSEKSWKLGLLKFFSFALNGLLLPLGLVLFHDFKKKGIHLFFTAEYEGRDKQ